MSDEIAITGQTGTFRKLTDGRFFATVEIDPEHIVLFAQHYSEQGRPIAIMLLNEQADRQRRIEQKAKSFKGPFGEQAKELKQSGFFRRPDVWQAIGTDDEFLAWLRTNPCAFNKNISYSDSKLTIKNSGSGYNESGPTPPLISSACGGDVVAAHVRRIADGAGTGIKPKYSAIPLCNNHHMLQHQKGESALGGKEWFDQQRIKYIEQWSWGTLKATLGYESFSQVSVNALFMWAKEHNLDHHLPNCYKNLTYHGNVRIDTN